MIYIRHKVVYGKEEDSHLEKTKVDEYLKTFFMERVSAKKPR